ncbi:MAG: exosortase-associated EpsI family protein [Planctomycetota bacterium]|jgi:hypothetical protein
MGENRNIAAIGCSLLSVRFLLSAFILILTAVGLRPGMRALAEYYQKEPIVIRRPLQEFDVSGLPTFRKDWQFKFEPATDDIETEDYAIIKFKQERTGKEVALFVTYYSDPQSKVPHTPDVCYRQGGAVVKKMTTVTIDTPESAPEHPQIKARLILLQMPNCEQVVIYSFCAEGQLVHTRGQVRWLIGKPGNRHTYFSKIEVATNHPTGTDPTPSIEICKKLFRESMSILLTEYFPDKEQLKRR